MSFKEFAERFPILQLAVSIGLPALYWWRLATRGYRQLDLLLAIVFTLVAVAWIIWRASRAHAEA